MVSTGLSISPSQHQVLIVLVASIGTLSILSSLLIFCTTIWLTGKQEIRVTSLWFT